MSRIGCRAGRAERIGIGVFVVTFLALYGWAAHFRLDLLDEGYFVYTSSRVLVGELPYRDFSTPYTPAFFYLNALLFRLFGFDVITLRVSLIVARLAMLLLVYRLGRRVMPPAFAALPVLLLVAEDQVPSVWESHPAWWATVAMLLSVWCVCRHREGGGARWWVAAGLAGGVSFAFKQNIGLFTLAALAAVAIAEGDALPAIATPGWLRRRAARLPRGSAWSLWRVAGSVSLVGLCLGTAKGMQPHLDPLVFGMFSAPFAALGAARVWAAHGCPSSAERSQCPGDALSAAVTRLGLLAASFVGVTLGWLAPMTAALGPQATPLAAFFGAIDTAGYYLALEGLRPAVVWVLGLAVLAVLVAWVTCRPWPWQLRAAVSVGAAALAAGFVAELLRPAPAVHPRLLRAALLLSVDGTTNLLLYLPAAAFWVGFTLLLARRVPPSLSFDLRWYLLAGSLLLLNQYPRMDETHLLFSGALLWVVGAYGLWRLYEWMTRGHDPGQPGSIGRAVAYLSLLSLPLSAAWPTLEARREDLLVRQAGAVFRLGTPHYVPLDLPGARVSEVEEFALKYQELAAYFRQHSRPDERIFVYPAAPLLYSLVDRPNATRFNHVFPGLLSAAEERETIDRLSLVPATYVVWDSFGAEYWGLPGTYRGLTDYIWEAYEPVDSIGGFEVLRRKPR